MRTTVKTLVAVDDGHVARDAVQASLPVGSEIEVVGIIDGLDEAWRTLQDTPTDLLVVAADGYSERALLLIESAVKQQPDRPVVVLCEATQNGFVRRVFEAGADDLVTLPESPAHVLFALQKAVARKAGAAAAAGTSLAPLICVLGPKGGTGKTLTACNLGVALASGGHDTVLIDLDLQFGDVALALGLPPEKTIYDLARAGGSIDADKVGDYVVTHSSGLRVLLAPTRPDQAALITVEFLRDVYAALRGSVDYVVVDTPPGFSPEVIASIDNSSHVCMVGMLDALSLKNTKLGLETLDLMGYSPDRITLVLNRSDSRVGITTDDVVSVIGRQPDVTIPSDREIPRTTNQGVPIVLANPRSSAANAFNGLASTYTQAEPSANGHHENGGVRSLLRRRG
jgi:pilus assembly protein CpaE